MHLRQILRRPAPRWLRSQRAALLLMAGALCLAGVPTRAEAQAPDVIYANNTRNLSSAPTYMGSSSGTSACNTQRSTAGREPNTRGERYPLFLYFVGTLGDYRQAASAKAVVEAMAQRGYVAVQVPIRSRCAAAAHGAPLQGGVSVRSRSSAQPATSETDETTAEFSVQIEHVDGSVDERIVEHLVPREWTLVHIDAPLARKVTVQSERGNLVKIESILLQGSAGAP